jgi:hypothetical protein
MSRKKTSTKKRSSIPVKDGLLYVERLPLGLRDKGHMGSSYFSTPNPKPGVVFTYFVKDDIKTLKELRKESEKAKSDKGEKFYYPTLDSLRAEDEQQDPYLFLPSWIKLET